MGEAKRRGDFESRKAQAVQQAEHEAAGRINGTSAKRRKQVLCVGDAWPHFPHRELY